LPGPTRSMPPMADGVTQTRTAQPAGVGAGPRSLVCALFFCVTARPPAPVAAPPPAPAAAARSWWASGSSADDLRGCTPRSIDIEPTRWPAAAAAPRRPRTAAPAMVVMLTVMRMMMACRCGGGCRLPPAPSAGAAVPPAAAAAATLRRRRRVRAGGSSPSRRRRRRGWRPARLRSRVGAAAAQKRSPRPPRRADEGRRRRRRRGGGQEFAAGGRSMRCGPVPPRWFWTCRWPSGTAWPCVTRGPPSLWGGRGAASRGLRHPATERDREKLSRAAAAHNPGACPPARRRAMPCSGYWVAVGADP
jgi:hypothetical protein